MVEQGQLGPHLGAVLAGAAPQRPHRAVAALHVGVAVGGVGEGPLPAGQDDARPGRPPVMGYRRAWHGRGHRDDVRGHHLDVTAHQQRDLAAAVGALGDVTSSDVAVAVHVVHDRGPAACDLAQGDEVWPADDEPREVLGRLSVAYRQVGHADAVGGGHGRSGAAGTLTSSRYGWSGPSIETELVALDVLHHEARLVRSRRRRAAARASPRAGSGARTRPRGPRGAPHPRARSRPERRGAPGS